MRKLEIQYRTVAELKVRAGNPRTHSKKQIVQLAASIRQFGFVNPVLIDDEDRIVAGHGRLAAAAQLAMTEVPTVRLSHMSEAEIRAYVIADNKLAENAGWDRELLALEFEYLGKLEAPFELSVIGFDLPEIDLLIGEARSKVVLPDGDNGSEEEIAAFRSEPPITRLGDIWTIGRHRLICGDARDASVYERVLGGRPADMVFADPPFNVKIDGNVTGKGYRRHREFAMASGEMSPAEFTSFLTRIFDLLARHSKSGSIHYQCIDWRHLPEALAAGARAYGEFKNCCVWIKPNGGLGSLYRSQHELVLVFKSGEGKHINNVELGRHGRNRTNVWNYPSPNRFGASGETAAHPTVKPVALVADAILDCSRRGGIVLDPFAGSGTTLLAAQKTGRVARAIEIDPIYCDLTIRRLEKMIGTKAVLDHSRKEEPDKEAERRTSGAAPKQILTRNVRAAS